MASCTIFRNLSVPVKNKSLLLIGNDIANGKYKTEIEEIRLLLQQGKTEEASAKKKLLLAFTPSAIFREKRQMPYIEMYSGFIHLDFDKLSQEELNTAFKIIAAIPYTFLCFISPSGNGLKVFVEIDTDIEQHGNAYLQVQQYYENATGLTADPTCKDITRLCFMSYHPALHKNIENVKFKVLIEGKRTLPMIVGLNDRLKTLPIPEPPLDTTFIFNQQVSFTNQKSEYKDGNRNNYLYLLASNCNRAGLAEEDTLQSCVHQFNLAEKEIRDAVHSAYFHHGNEFAKFQQPAKTNEEENKIDGNLIETMPTLPDEIFPLLPDFLKRVTNVASSREERDILLLGSIVSLSSCLQNLIGYYDDKKVNSNLYLFITAQASAGKGRLIHCRQLVSLIHKEMREQSALLRKEYDTQLLDYNNNKGKDSNIEKPVKPPEKMLYIPANNSSTGFYQLLHDSGGKGLIFETEGDTLSQAFKSDYGNYSYGFRNAYHHEPISYYRRTDREFVEIERPCLSALLSGTPKQIGSLIPNAENGLFSRFMFYVMNMQPFWKDVFAANTENGLDTYFADLAKDFYSLYQVLNNHDEIIFTLTDSQKQSFNKFFEVLQKTYVCVKGLDYIGTVRRLGLIGFRIMMVCSALRILDTGDISGVGICDQNDFDNTLHIIRLLVKHAAKVYSDLPEEPVRAKAKTRKERFLDALPRSFNRQTYVDIALTLKIPDKTAQGYITDFVKSGLLDKPEHGFYTNPNKSQQNPDTPNNQEIKDIEEN